MKRRHAVLQAIEQLQHLAALFGKRRAQLAKQVELTEAQWRVMEGVATEHFIPSMFADGLDNTRGAVSKILRQLLGKKLIKVSISQEDGRQRKYRLTARGARILETLRALREDAIREIWGDLPQDELAAFNQLCDRLIVKLQDYAAREAVHNAKASTATRRVT